MFGLGKSGVAASKFFEKNGYNFYATDETQNL